MLENVWIYFIILGIAMIVAEIGLGVYTGFDLVLIGSILCIGGIIGSFTSATIMFAFTFGLGMIYLLIGRKFIKDKMEIDGHKTNIDQFLNKTGIVVEEIMPFKKGKVKVEGEVWLATSDSSLKVGETIKVKEVFGVTLKVVKW